MKHVLIVSANDDVHARAVVEAVHRRGGTCTVFDNSQFPTRWEVLVTNTRDNALEFFLINDRVRLNLSDLTGVWWRRPQNYDLSSITAHPSYRRFIAAECEQALAGGLTAAVGNFINPIAATTAAAKKLVQLQAARAVGLRVPITLVTSNPGEALAFYEKMNGNCIYKPFTGARFGLYETRLLLAADLHDLWRIRDCPTIFQEHIEGDYDARVTVIGGELFAARVQYKLGRHPVDSRVDRVPIDTIQLPASIKESVVALTKHLGLVYAAIDMRYSEKDGFTFFELNPAGQYLWIEIETNLPISDRLAATLLRADDTSRPN